MLLLLLLNLAGSGGVSPGGMLDDVGFSRVQDAIVVGAPVRVLGAPHHRYQSGRQMDCFALCAAAADCAAFVDHRHEGLCVFMASGGKVRTEQPNSDVYVRQKASPPPLPPSPPPSPPPLPLLPIVPSLPPAITLSDDEHHRIFEIPRFLSQGETDTLRKFAESCFAAQETGHDLPIPIGRAGCEAGRAAVALSRVEERIALLTQMPAHEGEEAIMFARQLEAAGDGPWFVNIHHDKNKFERREATVLVYLSTQLDSQGGHTVFPTLPGATRAHNGSSTSLLGSYTVAASDAFRRGRRALGCSDGSAGCGDEGGLVAHTQAQCALALRGTQQASALAVRPVAGTALVFWSVQRDGTPDAAMWHTGCLARSLGSAGRWTLQKFKTPAADASSGGGSGGGSGSGGGGGGGGSGGGGGGGTRRQERAHATTAERDILPSAGRAATPADAECAAGAVAAADRHQVTSADTEQP